MKKWFIYFITLCLNQALAAQTFYSSIPLPGSTSIDKRYNMDLKIDDLNNVWLAFGSGQLGTSTIGLAKYDGSGWTTWNKDNSGLPTNSLTSIAFQGSTVWVGTLSGLAKKSGDTWTVYNQQNSGIVGDSVLDVSVYKNTIWVATQNGVSKFDGTTWTNYTTSTHPIADNKVNTVLAGSNGVWIGTNNGLSQLSGTTWSTFNTSNSGLKTNKIFTLEQTTDGAVWIGADTTLMGIDLYAGVYILKNNTITRSQEYVNYCDLKEVPLPIYSMGVKGTHTIVPAGRMIPASNHSTMQFVELGMNTRTTYKSQSKDGISLIKFICAVSASNKFYWCGRGDSLYCTNLSAYVDPQVKTLSYLNINKVSTPILNRGDMFWDLEQSGYEVPKGSCKRALFASTLWMGGVSNSDLRIAAQTYRQSGNDYYTGPLRPGLATTDSATIQQYDRIWRINRQTIEDFKVNFAAGRVANGSYIVPENLLSWPAHGDSANGFAPYLAPFIDVNADGKYNPMDGDYPKIKGDQMLYWIFNDNGGIHSETMGKAFGFEIHASAYGYTCDAIADNDSNTALNYTTFYEYDIINRSTETFDSVKYGIWTDPDIGYYADDYIRSNPKKNYVLAYNGDNHDEGMYGYGENPPAVAIAILNNQTSLNTLSGFRYYNNDFSSTGNPSKPEHYWAYLNNSWKDGSPLTYGGTGKGGSDTASFMFPGNDDLGGRVQWTEETSQNVPGDRRMMPTLSSINAVLPGSEQKIEFAVVFSQAQSGGAMASVTKLDTDIDKVRNWYANQSFPSCLDLTTGIRNVQPVPDKKVTIFPNPANQSIGLSLPGLSSTATYAIVDITGRIVLSGKVLTSISIQDLQQGVYFVEVKDGGQQYVSKFIKN